MTSGYFFFLLYDNILKSWTELECDIQALMDPKLFTETVKLEATSFVSRIFLLRKGCILLINRVVATGRKVNFQT